MRQATDNKGVPDTRYSALDFEAHPRPEAIANPQCFGVNAKSRLSGQMIIGFGLGTPHDHMRRW